MVLLKALKPSFLLASTQPFLHSFRLSMSSVSDWQFPRKIEEMYDLAPVGSNRPTAGARTEAELPVGSADIQLYSVATPNGQKVGILLEELGIDYDAHVISIGKGDQFGSGFISINPNNKIPGLLDKSANGGNGQRVFESGSILLYLAEKYGRFIPTDPVQRVECLNWLFWGAASFGPTVGVFGHYFVHARPDATEARGYGMGRYGMEVQRHLAVLEQNLSAGRPFVAGDDFSIADIISFTWVNAFLNGFKHPSGITGAELLSVRENYPQVVAWAERIAARPGVQRGLTVCNFQGVAKPWLVENK